MTLRTVEVLDTYEVAKIGTMTATREPDPPWQLGEAVLVNGELHRICRIERFAVPITTGRTCGLSLVSVET